PPEHGAYYAFAAGPPYVAQWAQGASTCLSDPAACQGWNGTRDFALTQVAARTRTPRLRRGAECSAGHSAEMGFRHAPRGAKSKRLRRYGQLRGRGSGPRIGFGQPTRRFGFRRSVGP